jgi:hypothetical protein
MKMICWRVLPAERQGCNYKRTKVYNWVFVEVTMARDQRS